MLKCGKFSLESMPFCVVEVIKQIMSIFVPQLDLKDLKIDAIVQGQFITSELTKVSRMPMLIGDERRFK